MTLSKAVVMISQSLDLNTSGQYFINCKIVSPLATDTDVKIFLIVSVLFGNNKSVILFVVLFIEARLSNVTILKFAK